MLPPLTMQTTRPFAGVAAQRRGERERARALGDDARPRREQPHGVGDLVERHGDRGVDELRARGPTSSAAARGRPRRRRTTAA